MYLAPRADSLGAMHVNISVTHVWRFGPYSGHGLHSSKYFNVLYFRFAVFSSG